MRTLPVFIRFLCRNALFTFAMVVKDAILLSAGRSPARLPRLFVMFLAHRAAFLAIFNHRWWKLYFRKVLVRNYVPTENDSHKAKLIYRSLWNPRLTLTPEPEVLDGFFPYLAQMITSMGRCVACHDLWPWPISSRSFDLVLTWGIQHDSIVWVIMRRRGYPQNAGVLVVLVFFSTLTSRSYLNIKQASICFRFHRQVVSVHLLVPNKDPMNLHFSPSLISCFIYTIISSFIFVCKKIFSFQFWWSIIFHSFFYSCYVPSLYNLHILLLLF